MLTRMIWLIFAKYADIKNIHEHCLQKITAVSIIIVSVLMVWSSSCLQMTHITIFFVTSVVEHWINRELGQWVHHEGSIGRPIAPRADALTTELGRFIYQE